MSCDLFSLATSGVSGLTPYRPGKSIEQLQREMNLDEVVKLASNENPLGPSQIVLDAISATKDDKIPIKGNVTPISKPNTRDAPANPKTTPIHCFQVTFSFKIGPAKALVKIG